MHNFGLKQKEVMKISRQTGGNVTLNFQEILSRRHSTYRKSSITILVRKHGTAPGCWVSDTQYVYRDVDDSLIMVSVGGGGGRIIVPGNVRRSPRVFRFKLSPDQKYVMLAVRPQR